MFSILYACPEEASLASNESASAIIDVGNWPQNIRDCHQACFSAMSWSKLLYIYIYESGGRKIFKVIFLTFYTSYMTLFYLLFFSLYFVSYNSIPYICSVSPFNLDLSSFPRHFSFSLLFTHSLAIPTNFAFLSASLHSWLFYPFVLTSGVDHSAFCIVDHSAFYPSFLVHTRRIRVYFFY